MIEPWAKKRVWIAVGIMAVLGVVIAAVLAFALFYTKPTCFDHTQNGKETGIDCGGSCSTLCSMSVQDAQVRFARALPQSGRQDLIAYIDNPNTDAYAMDAQLIIDIFRKDGHELERHATLSFPAKSSTPLFLTGIANAEISRVFVSFATSSPVWSTGNGRTVPAPRIGAPLIEDTGSGERVSAQIVNVTAYAQNDVPLIATVFGADGSAIAASQTVVPTLPPQGSAVAVFTWNEPFTQAVSRVEIVPLIALPRVLP